MPPSLSDINTGLTLLGSEASISNKRFFNLYISRCGNYGYQSEDKYQFESKYSV